jgi:hypothetical protein
MAIQVQFRRGTGAEWGTINPVLAAGELGLETDTNQIKVGDGFTAWNSLAYIDITGSPSLDKVKFDTGSQTLENDGELAWNATLKSLSYRSNNVNINVGQQNVVYVKNTTGTAIAANAFVSFLGSDSGTPTVQLASSAIAGTNFRSIGVTLSAISNNQFGFVATHGLIQPFNTESVLGSPSAGSEVFLSSVPGSASASFPFPPARAVGVGFVLTTGTSGSFFVNTSRGRRLGELDDVNASSPSNNQVISWIAANSRYEPRTITNVDVDASPRFFTENVVTANYTLALADISRVVAFNSASNLSLTVPTNASVAFPLGTVINVFRAGTGAVSIVAAGGVTLRNPGSVSAQYVEVSLRKRGTDEWVLSGNVTPA